MITTPADGLYDDVPLDDYLAWDALNHSTIKEVRKSERHLLAIMMAVRKGGRSPTEASSLGSACHIRYLQPHLLDELLVDVPINPRTQEPFGSDTKAFAAAVECNPGKVLVTPAQRETVNRMADALMNKTRARSLVSTPGRCEVAGIYTDESGLRFKFRIDKLIEDRVGFDYKTTRSAYWGDFRRSIANYGYHTQLAWYRRGYRELTGRDLPFGLLVQETYGEFESVVVELGDRTLRQAEALVSEWIDRARRAFTSGVWPGYSDEVEVIDVPDFFLGEFADGV